MNHKPTSRRTPQAMTNKRMAQQRAALFCFLVAALVVGLGSAQAQTIEDHSLPKSAIKTRHVQCNGGRLAKIRYDMRTEPTRMCVSVTDGSRPQSCTMVTQQQAVSHVKVLGEWICQ